MCLGSHSHSTSSALALPSRLSLVSSGAGAWDGPDCPGLVLITFCHYHGTVTSASAAGDVIPTLGVPTFPWLLPPRSVPHLLFLFELLS